MGDLPDWYRLVRAAKYLGVAPWDLAEKPSFWREAAIVAQNGENLAEADLAKRRNRRKGP